MTAGAASEASTASDRDQSETVAASIAPKIATSHSPGIAVARQPTAHTQGCQNPTPNSHQIRGTHRRPPGTRYRLPAALRRSCPQTPELPPESLRQRPMHPPPRTSPLRDDRALASITPARQGWAVALAEPPAPPTRRLPGLRPVAGALCLRRPTSGTLTPKSAWADQTSPRANRPCLDTHVLSAGAFWDYARRPN